MLLSMGDLSSLQNDIKTKSFKNVYLLYGEEDYLKSQNKKALLKEIANPEDTMNYAHFSGSAIDFSEVASIAQTMPFFSEHRAIVIEDSGIFNSKKSGEEGESEEEDTSDKAGILVNLLENIPETTYLVFIEQKVNRVTRTYKALKKVGEDIEFHRQEAPAVKSWIRNKVHAEGLTFEKEAFELFWSKVGDDKTGLDKNKKPKTTNDLMTISLELEKLISFCYESKSISKEAVELVVTKKLEEQSFVMTAAIARKDRKVALDKYYELLALRQEPIVILGTVRWQMETLLSLKDLLSRGMPVSEAASKLSMNPWSAENNAGLTKFFTFEELKEILTSCLETEESIKTGRMNPRIAVEVLIIKCIARE